MNLLNIHVDANGTIPDGVIALMNNDKCVGVINGVGVQVKVDEMAEECESIESTDSKDLIKFITEQEERIGKLESANRANNVLHDCCKVERNNLKGRVEKLENAEQASCNIFDIHNININVLKERIKSLEDRLDSANSKDCNAPPKPQPIGKDRNGTDVYMGDYVIYEGRHGYTIVQIMFRLNNVDAIGVGDNNEYRESLPFNYFSLWKRGDSAG